MKKLYLATVCFFPPLYAVLLVLVFLRHFPFPAGALPFLMIYFFVGFVVVLIDLWRSSISTEKKTAWTIAHLFVGLISLPIYWFVVMRRSPPPLQY